MSDAPTLITVAGAAIALGAGALALAQKVINRNGHHPRNGKDKAGNLSPEDWEGRMVKMHEASEERLMRDIRLLMDARTLILVEKVTQPIVLEIRGLRDDLAKRGRR